MTTSHVPGAQLSRLFLMEVVQPLIATAFRSCDTVLDFLGQGLRSSGFDTEMGNGTRVSVSRDAGPIVHRVVITTRRRRIWLLTLRRSCMPLTGLRSLSRS